MDDIKTIREALEEGRKWMSPVTEGGKHDRQIVDNALAALSRLAEPGEDARELACAVYCAIDADIDAADAGKPLRELEYVSRAAALIERYVAAQVEKAREEEREDARELAHELHDKCMTLVNPNSLYDYEVELDTTMASALIERYAAAQVAKAREEELKRCANAVEALRNDIHNGDACYRLALDYVIAAIKEAGNGR